MNIIVLFVILSILNVILSTIRSLTTIKSGKVVASIVSAVYFAFYNVVVIYTVADFDLWIKIAITFGCNLVGVFVVKLIEEKMRKDKLWKVEMTIRTSHTEQMDSELNKLGVPHSYITISPKHTKFECYCQTQKDTSLVKELGTLHNAKFFATECERLI